MDKLEIRRRLLHRAAIDPDVRRRMAKLDHMDHYSDEDLTQHYRNTALTYDDIITARSKRAKPHIPS
jgi:hypothetical protein